jgi:hypothetical protein
VPPPVLLESVEHGKGGSAFDQNPFFHPLAQLRQKQLPKLLLQLWQRDPKLDT